jgi:predicted dehydrogenase
MAIVYRAALIGCGNIGAGVERYSPKIQPWAHASVFSTNPRTELVALVDADPVKLEKAHGHFPSAATFADAEEMCKTVKPDIVIVATPTSSHKALTLLAVRYGVKAIVCEKPIAVTPEDGEEMIRACREAGVPLFINHIRRFDSVIRAAKARLPDIGEVLQANARYTRGIHNNGTHTIDLLRFFLGDVTRVAGIRNQRTEAYTDLPGDQNIDGLLWFASGACAAIQSFDANDYSIFDFDWYGRNGLISLRHFGFRVEVTGKKDCSAFIGHKELDELHPERTGETRSFMVSMVQHIVDCLDGVESSVSTGEDGVAALRVIQALERSAAQGGIPVQLSVSSSVEEKDT